MKLNEKFGALDGKLTDPRTRRYIAPKRIVMSEGDVSGAEALLHERSNQITLVRKEHCRMANKPGGPHARIVLDYGMEFPGSIRLMIWGVENADGSDPVRCNVSLRTGESVMEALTPIGVKNTTNDHAIRDRVMNVGFYSANETNESGQRFVCIELLDDDAAIEIKAVQGVLCYLDVDYLGSFSCSDEKLSEIWQTAAYTAHVNMQEYLWDGIKRDRLVWIGDMHTEVMTILAAFGYNEIVPRSLDLVRRDVPPTEWMYGMPSYSVWWLLNQYEWYMAFGDKRYLNEQREYIRELMKQLCTCIDENGAECVPEVRFIDWPTRNNSVATHAGLQALWKIAFDCGAFLMRELGEKETAEMCERASALMKKNIPELDNAKQSAALLALSGMEDPKKINDEKLSVGGAHGYSTFFGYYILAAKAMAGDHAGALRDIKDYWGGMLDMGATSFWEDFDIEWMKNAGRIDEVVPEGKVDIHGDYGNFCYTGFRHSLCHGWASGPCPYMSRYVLGVKTVAPGKYRVEPDLAWLDWAKGTYPTPDGIISVYAYKDENGQTRVEIDAPKSVEIVG